MNQNAEKESERGLLRETCWIQKDPSPFSHTDTQAFISHLNEMFKSFFSSSRKVRSGISLCKETENP